MERLLGSNLYVTSASLLIAAGIIVAFISFLGSLGAYKEIRFMLLIFFVLLFLIFILMLLGGILGYVFRNQVHNILYYGSSILLNKKNIFRVIGRRSNATWNDNHNQLLWQRYGNHRCKYPCENIPIPFRHVSAYLKIKSSNSFNWLIDHFFSLVTYYSFSFIFICIFLLPSRRQNIRPQTKTKITPLCRHGIRYNET